MQPYFFPYIGYYQLINEVDVYVNLEHVSFMKRSYMVRNTIKDNQIINIPVSNGSQNETCNNIKTLSDINWFNKFYRKLHQLYGKEPNFDLIINEIIEPWKKHVETYDGDISISDFNMSSIKYVCKFLNINTIFESSVGLTNKKKNEGLQDIVKYYNGTDYINAIGGQKLYNKDDFSSKDINLSFIKMGDLSIKNPYNSIIDVLFTNEKEIIIQNLKNYTLI